MIIIDYNNNIVFRHELKISKSRTFEISILLFSTIIVFTVVSIYLFLINSLNFLFIKYAIYCIEFYMMIFLFFSSFILIPMIIIHIIYNSINKGKMQDLILTNLTPWEIISGLIFGRLFFFIIWYIINIIILSIWILSNLHVSFIFLKIIFFITNILLISLSISFQTIYISLSDELNPSLFKSILWISLCGSLFFYAIFSFKFNYYDLNNNFSKILVSSILSLISYLMAYNSYRDFFKLYQY